MATVKNEEAEHEGPTARAVPAAQVRVAAAGEDPGHEPAKLERKPREGKEKRSGNNVRKIRMERMMSKAELARRAGVSTLTIDRVENGLPCRMDTKRKILEALGLNPSDRVLVFGEHD